MFDTQIIIYVCNNQLKTEFTDDWDERDSVWHCCCTHTWMVIILGNMSSSPLLLIHSPTDLHTADDFVILISICPPVQPVSLCLSFIRCFKAYMHVLSCLFNTCIMWCCVCLKCVSHALQVQYIVYDIYSLETKQQQQQQQRFFLR